MGEATDDVTVCRELEIPSEMVQSHNDGGQAPWWRGRSPSAPLLATLGCLLETAGVLLDGTRWPSWGPARETTSSSVLGAISAETESLENVMQSVT